MVDRRFVPFDIESYGKKGGVCLHSVYTVLVKMYDEMKYIMNSIYN